MKTPYQKNFGSLSRGQKGQNPPHSLDLEKKIKFSKNFFPFFLRIESFWTRKSNKNFWNIFLPSDLKHSWHLEKKSKFSNFFFDFNFDDFDFDKFQCSLYTLLFPSSSLVCLIVMDLENVGTKIFDFFSISILMILIFYYYY